jgi:uncharacterized OB-fold protein
MRGRLVTFTVIRKPPAAFAAESIYAVVLVELTTGTRVLGRLTGWDPPPPVGATVRLEREANGIPVFALERATVAG